LIRKYFLIIFIFFKSVNLIIKSLINFKNENFYIYNYLHFIDKFPNDLVIIIFINFINLLYYNNYNISLRKII